MKNKVNTKKRINEIINLFETKKYTISVYPKSKKIESSKIVSISSPKMIRNNNYDIGKWQYHFYFEDLDATFAMRNYFDENNKLDTYIKNILMKTYPQIFI